MYNYKFFILTIMFFSSFVCKAQNMASYTLSEKEYVSLFNAYKSHLDSCISDDINIMDTAELKKVLLTYVYANARLDSTNTGQFKAKELSDQQMKNFKDQFMSFYRSLAESENKQVAKHLVAMPIRLSNDKCMYEKLTAFQKENTLIYYDDRDSGKILGYMLFIPRMKNIMSAPRIWSWVLMFKSGFWAFKAATGEEGMEYFYLKV